MADPGEGPGGPCPTLFLDQKVEQNNYSNLTGSRSELFIQLTLLTHAPPFFDWKIEEFIVNDPCCKAAQINEL